jgi:hypothetical protein
MEEKERCYSFILSRTPHDTTHHTLYIVLKISTAFPVRAWPLIYTISSRKDVNNYAGDICRRQLTSIFEKIACQLAGAGLKMFGLYLSFFNVLISQWILDSDLQRSGEFLESHISHVEN